MSNFTQSVILSTFDQMLETTPFEKITVSAIIKACSISRNTFYYHYQDIYALLDAWLQEQSRKYETPAGSANWDDQVKALLRACKNNKRKVYHLYNSISRGRVEQYVFSSTNDPVTSYVRSRAAGKNIPEKRITGIAEICRYAIVGYFLRFLWNNMTDDIDSSMDVLSVLFNDIVERTLTEDA